MQGFFSDGIHFIDRKDKTLGDWNKGLHVALTGLRLQGHVVGIYTLQTGLNCDTVILGPLPLGLPPKQLLCLLRDTYCHQCHSRTKDIIPYQPNHDPFLARAKDFLFF